MSKTGSRMIQSANEALAYAQGRGGNGFAVHTPVDVKALRRTLGMAQAEFADAFGLAIGTVRDWEQGRTRPDRPAQVLLQVIEQEPDAVRRVLARGGGAETILVP